MCAPTPTRSGCWRGSRSSEPATSGTGKTVVAALDYRRHSEDAGRDLSLLFDFGEIHAGGKIASGERVFGMINSLNSPGIDLLSPEAFDVVIVDEFHHAAAPNIAT